MATTNQTIRCHDPDGLNLNYHNCENFCQLFGGQFIKNTWNKNVYNKSQYLSNTNRPTACHHFLFTKWAIFMNTNPDLSCTVCGLLWTDEGPKIKCLMTHSSDLAHQISSNTLSSFRIKRERMNMTSGSTMIFLNFLWRDHKNVTCTLVSDSAGTNNSLGLQSASHVKCTNLEWCKVANLEEQSAKECSIWLRRSYIPTV